MRTCAFWQNGAGLPLLPFRRRLVGLRKARTPIRNVYLTGQDACTSGVTGALLGGIIAASAVLGRNLVSAATRVAA